MTDAANDDEYQRLRALAEAVMLVCKLTGREFVGVEHSARHGEIDTIATLWYREVDEAHRMAWLQSYPFAVRLLGTNDVRDK